MWGCQAEVRIYNPHEKKLDSRTISGISLDIRKGQKGIDSIVESGNARVRECSLH